MVLVAPAPIAHSVVVPMPTETVRMIADYYAGEGPSLDKMRLLMRSLVYDPASLSEELVRARENVKARVVLGMESTGARMHRLGGSLLFGLPLLETDEVMERIDAVTIDDMRALVDDLWAPGRLSAAGIGPDEDKFCAAVEGVAGSDTQLAA